MVPARRALTVTLLVAALVVAAAAPHAAGDRRAWRSRFGIVSFDWRGDAPAMVAALGVGVVRASCDWPALEPARGLYAWQCADQVIAEAQRRRLRTYMTVSCTPAWASGAAGCGRMPRDVADWYDFVERFVARYSGTDTILGVWNEPNLSLADDADGDRYALLFVNASNARNRIDPRVALAGPETSHHALADGYYAHVMDRLAAMHAFDPQDIVSVHWYPDGPPLVGYMDAVHDLAGAQEVWLSETGDATADLAQQAAFYDRVIAAFAGSGRAWWTHLVFYRLWDGSDCCTEAIVRGDFSAKPAFATFRSWLIDGGELRDPPRRDAGATLQ